MNLFKKALGSSLCFFFLAIFSVFSQSPDTALGASAAVNLSSLISNQRIIILGETNHGVSQQYSTIASFSKQMFEEKGFEILQSESSFYKTFVALLTKGKPSIQGLSMIYQDAEEFVPLLRYAQQNNLLHAGFDPQVIVSDDGINFIVDHFDLDIDQKEVFRNGIEDLAASEIPDNNFIQLCNALQKKLQKDVLKSQLIRNLLWANEIALKTANLSAQDFKAYDSNPRDRAMGMNVLFWDGYFGHKKTIVLGASTHLAYGFDLVKNEELAAFSPMGKVLKDSLPASDLINIAFSCKNGEWRGINDAASSYFPPIGNTLETGHSHYPILLSTDTLTHHASLVLGEAALGNWSETFDYILVFENAKPVRHKVIRAEMERFRESNQVNFLLKDESSGQAVEFAHIYFPSKREGATSNDKGRFVVKNVERFLGSEMVISRIGYQSKSLAFNPAEEDTIAIKMTPQDNFLKEVVVRAESNSPLAILLNARKKLTSLENPSQLNYYHTISDVNDGNDSLHNETILQFVQETGESQPRVDILTRKKLKQSLYNKFKQYLSYPFISVAWPHPSNLGLFLVDEKKLSKSFLLEFEEQTSGQFIKIHFKALNHNRKVTGVTGASSYEGTIWIDSESFLPAKINLVINSKTSGEFDFSSDFEVKNNTLITVLSQHKHFFPPEANTNRQVLLEETSIWLKQGFIKDGDMIPRTSHDLTLIAPDQKVWDQFNEYVK